MRGRQVMQAKTTGRQGPNEDIEPLLIRLVNHRLPEGSVFLDGRHKLLPRNKFQREEGKLGPEEQGVSISCARRRVGGQLQEKIEGGGGLQAQGRDGVYGQQRWLFRYAVLPQKPGRGKGSGNTCRKAKRQSLHPAANVHPWEDLGEKIFKLRAGQGKGMGRLM